MEEEAGKVGLLMLRMPDKCFSPKESNNMIVAPFRNIERLLLYAANSDCRSSSYGNPPGPEELASIENKRTAKCNGRNKYSGT